MFLKQIASLLGQIFGLRTSDSIETRYMYMLSISWINNTWLFDQSERAQGSYLFYVTFGTRIAFMYLIKKSHFERL